MSSDTAEFVMVDTAVFAYKPVLRCLQATVEIPLWQELFAVSVEEIEAAVKPSAAAPLDLVSKIEAGGGSDLQSTLSLSKSVQLDASQLASLLAGLRQSVSLIQGPPGTGKSFIRALLTQALVKHTSEKTLVICYKNHALGQFLEDLLDIGIPPEYMVRLGAKSTTRTGLSSCASKNPTSGPSTTLSMPLRSKHFFTRTPPIDSCLHGNVSRSISAVSWNFWSSQTKMKRSFLLSKSQIVLRTISS